MKFFLLNNKNRYMHTSSGLRFKNRTVKRTSPRFVSGSMTVETAIVLPLFLFFFINLLSSIEMIRLHGNIAMALHDSGSRLSYYGAFLTAPVKDMGKTGHGKIDDGNSPDEQLKNAENKKSEDNLVKSILKEIGDLSVSYIYVKNEMIDYLSEDYLDSSPIQGGADGLCFFESEILSEDDTVDIGVTYEVSPPIEIGKFFSFRMSNRYYAHLWNGYDVSGKEAGAEEDNQWVYITKDSEVYHLTTECTHLSLSVRPAPLANLKNERNTDGGKYSRCFICARGNAPDVIYLCDEGDKYHYSRECFTLKREYSAVKLKEVENTHRPCSRCGGKETSEYNTSEDHHGILTYYDVGA